jgi:hypothetical protein
VIAESYRFLCIAVGCVAAKNICYSSSMLQPGSDTVATLSADLAALIEAGTSRANQRAANDADVRFDIIQTERWAPPPLNAK